MTYGDVHRFFLRTIANRGVLTMAESVKFIKNYTGQNKNGYTSLLRKLVAEINNEISPLQQRIKIVKDKNTESCKETLIFMMIASDNATKSQRIFTDKELNYFRTLLKEIISNDDKQLQSVDALYYAQAITKHEAEILLERWCNMHYLHKFIELQENTQTSRKGKQLTTAEGIIYYTIGLRAMYEFETYFTDNFKDYIEKCKQCKEIVFKGSTCTICKEALHTPCLEIHMENQHDNIRTPDTDIENESLMDSDSDDEENLLKNSRRKRKWSSSNSSVEESGGEIINNSVKKRNSRRKRNLKRYLFSSQSENESLMDSDSDDEENVLKNSRRKRKWSSSNSSVEESGEEWRGDNKQQCEEEE